MFGAVDEFQQTLLLFLFVRFFEIKVYDLFLIACKFNHTSVSLSDLSLTSRVHAVSLARVAITLLSKVTQQNKEK